MQGLDAVLGLPAIEAEAEVTDPAAVFQFFDRGAELGVVGPAIVPHMELQNIDGIDAKFFADQVGVFEDVILGKNIVIFVLRERRPFVIGGRNFGGGVEALFIARHGFAEQGVAFAFAVGPGGVEEVAARVDGELQGIERLAVIGAAPAAHAPESVGDVADFESGAA